MTHVPSALDPLLRQHLDVLPQPPIQIADGLILLDYDIDENMLGWLLVSLWGRKLELHSTRAGVFEGHISTALVDLGPRGAFFLEHVSIVIQRRPLPDETAIEITGRGRLELRGLATCDSNPLVVQGNLRLVHAEGTGEKYVRLDLLPARISLPIVGGVIFSFVPERLFFIVDDAGTLDIEMRAQCSIAGLPPFVHDALGNDVIPVDVRVTPDGLSLHAATVHDRLRLIWPALPAIGSLPEFHPGEFVAAIRHLHIDVGEQIVGRVDVIVQVPHVFHDFAEPQFSVRILADADGVQVRLLSSPLRALRVRPRAGESLDAHVDLGRYGTLSFALPVLRLEASTGNLVAEGRFAYEDLRIPLGPVITFLGQAGRQRIAERLPESIAVQPFGWTNILDALTNLFRLALGDGAIAEKAYEELNSLVEKMDRLPKPLRENFLRLEPPTELAYRLELTADLGARIHLSPAASPTKSKPLRLLVPLLGPSGPELIGVSLHQLALCPMRAGQWFTVELDADVQRFELLPIALAMTLAKEGMFAAPDELHTQVSLRKMVAVLSFFGGTPLLVPVFFDEIHVQHEGLDGLGLAGRWSFPRPHIDATALLGMMTRLHNLQNGDLSGQRSDGLMRMHVEASTGPFWIRWPSYLGAGRIDVEQATIEFEEPRALETFVAAIQRMDMDALLGLISLAPEGYPIEFRLGPSFRQASRQWAKVVEPTQLMASISPDEHFAETNKVDMAGKFRAWTGRVVDELAAMGKTSNDVRVTARIVQVTSRGLEVVVTLPVQPGESSVEHRLELQWGNFVGSAMKLAAMVGAELR